jgi:hypothetical protein
VTRYARSGVSELTEPQLCTCASALRLRVSSLALGSGWHPFRIASRGTHDPLAILPSPAAVFTIPPSLACAASQPCASNGWRTSSPPRPLRLSPGDAVTQYNDAAWVIGQRTREEFDRRFRQIVAEQIVTARLCRRMARHARKQGDMVLFRHLTLRSIALRRSAFMLCVECELTVDEIMEIVRRQA